MRKKHFLFASVLALLCGSSTLHAQDFKLTSSGYFKNQGVDVMAFDDIYPEGHRRRGMYHHERTPCGDEWRYPSGSHTRTMATRTETARPEAR